MMRVSVTTLEQFRRVCSEEWATDESLVAQVRGEPFEPTWQMKAGTAWHRAMEGDMDDDRDGELVRFGAYWFKASDIAQARKQTPAGLCEVKATRTWQTPIGPVCIVSQVDVIAGSLIFDHKVKFGTLDVKGYESSLQWRFYLATFKASEFRYLLWQFWEPDGDRCELADHVSCSFFPYVGMEKDCQQWLNAFVAWCDSKKLLPFLERDGSAPVIPEAA